MNWKNLLLVRFEILGLFAKTLTADDMYFYQNRENFPEQIQMQLFQKPNTFSGSFIAFPKSASICQYFENKRWSHHLHIPKIIDSKRGIKGLFPDNLSAVNVLAGPEHC